MATNVAPAEPSSGGNSRDGAAKPPIDELTSGDPSSGSRSPESPDRTAVEELDMMHAGQTAEKPRFRKLEPIEPYDAESPFDNVETLPKIFQPPAARPASRPASNPAIANPPSMPRFPYNKATNVEIPGLKRPTSSAAGSADSNATYLADSANSLAKFAETPDSEAFMDSLQSGRVSDPRILADLQQRVLKPRTKQNVMLRRLYGAVGFALQCLVRECDSSQLDKLIDGLLLLQIRLERAETEEDRTRALAVLEPARSYLSQRLEHLGKSTLQEHLDDVLMKIGPLLSQMPLRVGDWIYTLVRIDDEDFRIKLAFEPHTPATAVADAVCRKMANSNKYTTTLSEEKVRAKVLETIEKGPPYLSLPLLAPQSSKYEHQVTTNSRPLKQETLKPSLLRESQMSKESTTKHNAPNQSSGNQSSGNQSSGKQSSAKQSPDKQNSGKQSFGKQSPGKQSPLKQASASQAPLRENQASLDANKHSDLDTSMYLDAVQNHLSKRLAAFKFVAEEHGYQNPLGALSRISAGEKVDFSTYKQPKDTEQEVQEVLVAAMIKAASRLRNEYNEMFSETFGGK